MENQQKKRMQELDILRGFAVAVMILVVSPGAWEHVIPPLQHADWYGFTFADFVFPDFLFGVGMAIGLTYANQEQFDAGRRRFWTKTLRRVAGLVLLGLALNYLTVIVSIIAVAQTGTGEYANLRIPGVLQRIAFAFLIAVIVVDLTRKRDTDNNAINPASLAVVVLLILTAYWILLTYVPVPGYGAGDLSKAGNLPAYIDRSVFGVQHLWPYGTEEWGTPVLYDPEGILATLPASANVLLGTLSVIIWRRSTHHNTMIILALGSSLIVLGLLIDPLFPINKKIWTSSFVLLTGGLSMVALAIVSIILRFKLEFALAPLRVLGGNAILAFSLSIILSAIATIPIPDGSGWTNLQAIGFKLATMIFSNPMAASLACAVGVLGVILVLVWPLHNRGIHLRL